MIAPIFEHKYIRIVRYEQTPDIVGYLTLCEGFKRGIEKQRNVFQTMAYLVFSASGLLMIWLR